MIFIHCILLQYNCLVIILCITRIVLLGSVLYCIGFVFLQAPDGSADMHDDHQFSYALMPHLGSLQEAGVIRAAYAFNAPLRMAKVPAVVSVDSSIASPLVEVYCCGSAVPH